MARQAGGRVVRGERGGFMRLGGAWRVQYMEGSYWVVGHGRGHRCRDQARALKVRDRLLARERRTREAERARRTQTVRAEQARADGARDAGGAPLALGDVVAFDAEGQRRTGRITEIGGRSVAIEADDGDAIWRRAPAAVQKVPA